VNATEIAVLGGAFTVVGAIIGAVASLVAARYTWRRLSYNEAAARFRAAFVETIFELRAGKQDVFKVITEQAVAAQERALIEFEPFLSDKERLTLKATWNAYKDGPHTRAPGSLDNRPNDIARAEKNLYALLNCALPK